MQAIQQTLAVFAVLALLGVTLWWLRAKGLAHFSPQRSPRRGRQMQPIERLPLTPQHSLHLVRVAGRVLLVAVSPGGCAILESGLADSADLPGKGQA